jgi:hypothetical protein
MFGQVFSPQFMIWLLPLAAMASLSAKPWIAAAISMATMLTPIFYPSPEYYGAGLRFFQATILMTRNLILIWVWMSLMRFTCQQSLSTKQ